MSTDGSVSRWLGPLDGDPSAVQRLWELYFHRLVGLARLKLRGTSRRVADEEDVALSAFDSFCRHAADGRFPQMVDRDNLWRLLMVLTARKAAQQVRRRRAQKRVPEAVAVTDAGSSDEGLLEQVMSREPAPEMAAQVAEEYQRLLDLLGDKDLRAIAVARMEGYGVEEIADRVGYAGRSVKRKLQLIRSIWKREVGS